MRILDLGCGPATILAYLPAEIDYVGVDLSRKYIDAARSVYGKRARFYCLRVEDMNSAGLTGFDLVMGLGVLHHLDEYQARQFFIAARKALKEKGRCLLADPCLVPGQHPVARFLIRIDRGQNVRSARGYAVLAESAFCCLSQEISHDKLRIPYTHHIMQCWKTTP